MCTANTSPAPHHDVRRIDARLRRAGAACAGRVTWFERIPSTNRWLLAQEQGHARVCLTELQTAGRGTHGRTWHAPPSSAILMSMGWQLDGIGAAGLSLVAGLAAVDSMRRVGVNCIGLKWPNDLMARGRKLGGVLTELHGTHCVIGIGINVHLPPPQQGATSASALPPSGWIDLNTLGYSLCRDRLAADLMISLCNYLERFRRDGFGPFMDEWNGLNIYRGRAVTVRSAAGSFGGIAHGVDDRGALLVHQGDAVRRVFSGTVHPPSSVRPSS